MTESVEKVIGTVLNLARLATSKNNDNEARSAGVKACELILKHQAALFSNPPSRPRQAPHRGAPPKTSNPSVINPAAAKFNEWREFMRKHDIKEGKANERGYCVSCGHEFPAGEFITVGRGVGATHIGCAGWWWNYDFDDDIPF